MVVRRRLLLRSRRRFENRLDTVEGEGVCLAFLTSSPLKRKNFLEEKYYKEGEDTRGDKKIRKVKKSQLSNLSPSKHQNLGEFEFFRLEQWGMMLQSKLVLFPGRR